MNFIVRELNYLHKLWKNDLGPVTKDQSELLWKRFQEASKKFTLKNHLIKTGLSLKRKSKEKII